MLLVAPIKGVTLKELVRRTLASIQVDNTRKGYDYALRRFVKSGQPLTRAGLVDHVATLKKPSIRMVAIMSVRRLAHEAALAGYISEDEERRIREFKVPAPAQTRLGHWLSLEGCQKLLQLPNRATLSGARDLALFALLLGCGLRRREAVMVTWEQYQIREGRAVLVDIYGKGGKIRSVPVPEWGRVAIEHWRDLLIMRLNALGWELDSSEEGPILRSGKWVNPVHPLCVDSVTTVTKKYAKVMGIRFTPHDLRRTVAQLMRKAGAPIEQIQFTLGHSGVKTTERYLGGGIELAAGKAAVDLIEWDK